MRVFAKSYIIGETVKRLPERFRSEHPDIPWRWFPRLRCPIPAGVIATAAVDAGTLPLKSKIVDASPIGLYRIGIIPDGRIEDVTRRFCIGSIHLEFDPLIDAVEMAEAAVG